MLCVPQTKIFFKSFSLFCCDNKLSIRVSSKLFLPTFTQFFWFKYEQKQSSEAFSCVCEIDKNSEHESIFHDWKIFVSNFPEIWFAEDFFSVFILVFRKLFVTNNEFLWFLPSFIRIRRCGKLFEATTFIFSQLFLLLFFIYLISFSSFLFLGQQNHEYWAVFLYLTQIQWAVNLLGFLAIKKFFLSEAKKKALSGNAFRENYRYRKWKKISKTLFEFWLMFYDSFFRSLKLVFICHCSVGGEWNLMLDGFQCRLTLLWVVFQLICWY